MTTVVVPTFNSGATLAATLESIVSQSSPPRQVIVVDGGSTDGTLEVARRHLRPGDRVVSERDRGPYDAMNKGVRLAGTEVVAILNSDDRWLPGTLELVEERFRADPGVGIVHGNIEYVLGPGRSMTIKPTAGIWRWLGLGLPTSHPATFIRRRVYERVGAYDFGRFPVCADQDFVYRALAAGVKDCHVDCVLTVMMAGGLSNRSDVSGELDGLLARFGPVRRLVARAVRRLLGRQSRFYDGRVHAGFGREVLVRLLAIRRCRRLARRLSGRDPG